MKRLRSIRLHRAIGKCFYPFALLLLNGCIESPTVLFPDSAGEHLPGLAGAWKEIGFVPTIKGFGITRSADGQYSLLLDGSSAYREISIFNLDQRTHLVQVVLPEEGKSSGARYFIISKFGDNIFEIEIEESALPLAASMGVHLTKNSNGIFFDTAGDGEKFFHFLVKAIKGPVNFTIKRNFVRTGPVVDLEDATLLRDAASETASYHPATSRLAKRGYPTMLFKLAGFGLSTQTTGKDVYNAVLALKDAFAMGHPQAAMTLAEYYLTGPKESINMSARSIKEIQYSPTQALDWSIEALINGENLTTVSNFWKKVGKIECGDHTKLISRDEVESHLKCLRETVTDFVISQSDLHVERNNLEDAATLNNKNYLIFKNQAEQLKNQAEQGL